MNDDDLRVLRSRVQWVLSLLDRAAREQAAQEGNADLLALQAGAQLHAIGAMFDRSGRDVDREARSAIDGSCDMTTISKEELAKLRQELEHRIVQPERLDALFALANAALDAAPSATAPIEFQQRVQPWMMACFGPEISSDRLERGDRFLEEALELLQSGNYPRERIAALTDYVFDRPQGEINQEVGGVMVTLAAYCLAFGIDMHAAGETELARIWTKVEKIRAKQATKPTGSALPIAAAEIERLSAYERSVLKKTALRNGYKALYDLDTGDVIFAKASSI